MATGSHDIHSNLYYFLKSVLLIVQLNHTDMQYVSTGSIWHNYIRLVGSGYNHNHLSDVLAVYSSCYIETSCRFGRA